MGNLYILTDLNAGQREQERNSSNIIGYTIRLELHNQEKQIILCKVLAHMVINRNEEVDRAAK